MTDVGNRTTPLRDLVAEFEAYLADGRAWSDERFRIYRSRFADLDVEGDSADDLLHAAWAKIGTEEVDPDV